MKTIQPEQWTAEALALLEAQDYDVEAILRQYPEQAAELRPALELAARMANYYAEVPAPPGGLAEGRAWVLETAAQQRALGRGRASRPRRTWRLPALGWGGKLLGALLAFLLVLIPVGGQVARASARSAPGHVLYPLKRAAENLYYTNVHKPEAQVTLALAFSAERVAEIERLADAQRAIPAGMAGEIHALTQATLQSAAWASEAAMPSLLSYIVWEAQTNVLALENLKEADAGQNQMQLRKVQEVYLYQYLMARVALEHPDAFRTAYQAGRPELMAMPLGNPLEQQPATNLLEEMLKSGNFSLPEIPVD